MEELVGGMEEGRICQDCRRKGMVALKERENESRDEKKMEQAAKEGSMMLNLNLPSTPTLVQPNPPKWQTGRTEEDWSLQEERIVKNLRFSLEQLRVVGDEASYMDLVEKLVIGPASLRATHMEQLLGINPDLFTRASSRRHKLVQAGLRPSWGEDMEVLRSRPRTSCSPERRLPALSRPPEVKSPRPMRWKFPNLHHQFLLFAKFGETCSDGSQITLTQSDKWLRQAKVVDGWEVTTTDTAIAFRKISRGSVRLSYSSWRKFLQELSDRGTLSLMEV